MREPPPDGPPARLLLPATVFGMAAIVALPLSATAGAWLVPLLVFATPIVLVLAGRMRAQPGLVAAGAALALLLLAIALLTRSGIEVGLLANLGPFVLLVGPVVAVIAVGLPLRDRDLVAAAGFLLSGTIAVIAGFAVAGTPGAAVLVIGVGLVGCAIVAVRLRSHGVAGG
ncbi:MAG: hypothetical protein R6V28_12515 [Nitriliruptoraceae bacterium]